MSVAPQQVDLGTMSRESIIDVAKRQNVQIKEKNTKIQELTRALAEAQSNTPLQTLVNEKEDAIIKLREALHEKVSHIEQLELKTHSWKEKVMEMANNDQRTIDALRTQLASTTHQLDALKAEAQQLRQIASPPKATEETQELRRQLASLTTAHDELSKQYAEQERTSQAAYNALKQSAIQRFQQMQTAADELRSQLQHANNQIQHLTTQNLDRNTTNKHTAELEAEVAGSHSSGEREAQLTGRISELQTTLEASRSVVVDGDSDVVGTITQERLNAVLEKQEKWKKQVKSIMEKDAVERCALEAQVIALENMVRTLQTSREEVAADFAVVAKAKSEAIRSNETLKGSLQSALEKMAELEMFRTRVMESARDAVGKHVC